MEKNTGKNYGWKALIPILVFLGLYLGCGTYFSIKGVDSRYLLLMKSLVNAEKTSVLQGFSRVLRLFKRKPFS